MKTIELTSFSGPTGWQLSTRPDVRDLADTEVLVQIKALSLNYRDLLVAQGLYDPSLQLPTVPISDGAGLVVGVGRKVTRFKVGNRVAGSFFQDWIDGPLLPEYHDSSLGAKRSGVGASQVALPQDGLVAIPEHLSFEEASTLPCAAVTAWNALFELGSLKAGQTVLVQGTGGVSIFSLQLARAAGALVLAITSTSEKAQRLSELGAEAVVNYRETAQWGQAILDLTQGGGVDHVIDVGGPNTLAESLVCLKTGGTISLIGVLSGFETSLPLFPILLKAARLQGVFVGSRGHFENLNAALGATKIRPVVDRVFPLGQASQALEWLASAQHFGKVVIGVED